MACKSVPEQILMLSTYRENAAERLALGIPPLPLEASQAKALTELLENPPSGEEQELLQWEEQELLQWEDGICFSS